MGIIIGSARHDENGRYTGGKKGDQLQKYSANDMQGECSLQPFYLHHKGWKVLRPVNGTLAKELAKAMVVACNNKNLGYGQDCQRKTIDNIDTLVPINVDCSKLVRDCIYKASRVDVGNFTTANEVAVLTRSGLFLPVFDYKTLVQTPLYNGDVLVTKTKGHTVIVVSGSERPVDKQYYPKYTGNSTSIVTALKDVGEKDTSFTHRNKIANANGITKYNGLASQNTTLVKLLKGGRLVKA